MKKSQAFLLTAVLLVFIFVSGLWFQSRRLLPSSKLHDFLVQRVQVLTEGVLKYQNVRVGYFPQPMIVFERAQMTFSNHPSVIEAEKIQFDFDILPLFFGKVEPAAFYVQSGKAEFQVPGFGFLNPMHLENFSLQVGAVRPQVPIPFHFASDVVGKPNALVIKGNVTLDSVERWNWEKASGYVVAELKQLSLHSFSQASSAVSKHEIFFKDGQIDTSLEIKKKPHEAFLELTGTGAGRGLVYEVLQQKNWVAPPALDAEWVVKAAWNQDTSELKFHKGSVKLPFGEIEMNGNMKLNTGEIAAMHMMGSNMALEDLLKYSPGLENVLPFQIGFSGPGKWVLSMDGTFDHLSIHFDWDLAKALLSYGQYFTKPKDLPLDMNFDLLLQKGAVLGGDFAVKFKELSMKGNLKDLDLKTGEGQLNLITNKFSMTGWEEYIPALEHYKLDGDAKLMANWKGDLRKLEKAEHVFNMTFDKASWTVPEGSGIRNASVTLDYGPIMMEARKMQFEIGGSKIVADLKITGFSEKPQATAKIQSDELKPLEVWKSAVALFPHKEAAGGGMEASNRVRDFIQGICPQGQALVNVLSEINYKNEAWDVPVLQFESYGGKADLKGTLTFKDREPEYHLEGEFQGVDMGRFLARHKTESKVLEGALDLKGAVDGTGWGSEAWSKSLRGQGEFTLKNGKFLTFDLKNVLSTIEPFEGIGKIVSDLRNFSSADFQWKLSEGKVTTDNLLVKSEDYVMDGEGTLGFDGLANFRMDVFLSSSLASKLLPHDAKPFIKNPQAHMGPVPTLLSGTLLDPEVKPDPAQVAELTEKIRKGKTKDILVELVLE